MYEQSGLARMDQADNSPKATLATHLQRLRTLKLIDAANLVDESIQEILVRRIFADKQTMVVPQLTITTRRRTSSAQGARKHNKPEPVSLARALVDTVRNALPLPPPFTIFSLGERLTSTCARYMRELRIALHEDNMAYLNKCYDTLAASCPDQFESMDPLIRILANPFDPTWFGTLPAKLQAQLLSVIFYYTIHFLQGDGEALAVALVPGLRTTISNYIRTTRQSTGLVPLAAGLVIEESWQKSLRALRLAVDDQKRKTAGQGDTETRIVYLPRFPKAGTSMEIRPLEQKRTPMGTWTKGRPIALQRLANGENLNNLTTADKALQAAIRRTEYSYSQQYLFNLHKALPALVGHPLLFLAESPTTPVEIVTGQHGRLARSRRRSAHRLETGP